MAEITFDILQYMSGLTGFTLDKAVLIRIALERGVSEVTEFDELTEKDIDLLTADILLTAYLSPNVWASFQSTHGSFTKNVGNQTLYLETKEQIYKYLYGIYEKYGDKKLEILIDTNAPTVFFRNDI